VKRRHFNSLEEADALVWANVKGPKKKDYIGVAEALMFVKRLPGYKSNKAVAERYPISAEMVREFISLLQLPEEILDLYGHGELTLEHGRQLNRVRNQNPALLMEVASLIRNLQAHEARDVVVHMLRYPELTAQQAKEQAVAARQGPEHEYHVISIVTKDEYDRLQRAARASSEGVSELVTRVVRDWLSQRSD
jgi:hypothetical protein